MSQGSRIKVHITGGPPWGFRLQGGGSGNTPVSIAKIRRKSKAFNARLQEGDEIVSVNGRNCQNISRDVTMSYVDGAKESLDLEVIRRDKNFNTVNTTSYNISNNNPNITTGKAATIQLVPSGNNFQPPVRPASMGSTIRQPTNIQNTSRIIPVENRSQKTVTRTITTKVGDEDAKTSTTTEVKTYGPDGQETTNKVINVGGQPQQKPVVFQPKVVSNPKPTGWSPIQPQQQQQQQQQVVRVGQKTTINLQGSYDEEPDEPPKHKWAPMSQPSQPQQPSMTPSSQPPSWMQQRQEPTPQQPQQPSWMQQRQEPKPQPPWMQQRQEPKPQPPWMQQRQEPKPQPPWMQQRQEPEPQQHTWSPNTQQQNQPQTITPGQRATIQFQGNFNEPQNEAPQDLASLIPSQSTSFNSKPSLRPSLAKPQSVSPSRHPHPPKMTPAMEQDDTRRWSAPAKSSVGKEMTITFGGPGQGMRIPIGVAAPMSMAQTTPSEQSTVTKYSTRTVTTLEETQVDESSDEEIQEDVFRTPSPRIPVPPPMEKPFDIMDDPSLILRGLYKVPGSEDNKKSKSKMIRPKSFPGAAVDEVDLDETDKMKVCKTIADLLMFPKNKSARGAKMFAKRRKRSAKYTIEAYGIRGEDEELPEQIGPKNPIPRRIDLILDSPVHQPKPPPVPAPPPPPPPSMEPVWIPSLGISVAPTDFSISKKKEDKCDHKAVSPMQCGMLVADLKGAKGGRGASMFERRRKRSEKFVLSTEGKNKDVQMSPENKENAEPATVTLEFIARHGSEEVEQPQSPITKVRQDTPAVMLMKTPWEAAAESPIGSVSSAFKTLPKHSFAPPQPPTLPKHSFAPQQPQQQDNKPKPPAEWMRTSSMLPQVPAQPPTEPKIKPKFRVGMPSPSQNGHAREPLFKPKFDARKQQNQSNYKDFNIKPRGWGNSPKQSPEDTPPSVSPASVHSGEFAGGSPRLSSQFPVQPLKYSGGYNNFNAKPRSFAPPSGGFSQVEPMESEEL